MEKVCNKCKISKSIELFNKSTRNKDGLCLWCKSCFSSYNKLRLEDQYIKKLHHQRAKKWYKENKDKAKIQNKNWIELNRKKYNKHHNNRYLNDILYKLRKKLRIQFNSYLKLNKGIKYNSCISFLGCNIEELKQHLEKQFLPEMNWENHGEIWEIDHKEAMAKFDLTKLEEQQKCFHFTNFQPLFKTTEIAVSFGYTNHIGNRNKGKK